MQPLQHRSMSQYSSPRTPPDRSALPVRPDHSVHFYQDDEALFGVVTDFLGAGLRSGQPAIVIATAAHVDAFTRGLRATIDLDEALEGGRLLFLDADATLAEFMVAGMPDEARFNATVGALIQERLRDSAGAGLRAFGEMVEVLWRAGHRQAAIRLEEYWHRLAARHPFALLCAYSMGNFFNAAIEPSLEDVCNTHTYVRPVVGTIAPGNDEARRISFALLEQRANALEAEVDHRRQLEVALREALAERARAESMARDAEQELRDFFENAVDGMHWMGPDGTILWANKAELDLLGYEREEYVGHHVAEFHADQQIIDDILERLWRNETIRNREAALRRKDGSLRHVVINASVFWRDCEFVHTRCVTRDITEQKALQQQRERMARHLAVEYAVTKLLADPQRFDAVSRLLQAVCEAGGWQVGAFWMVDEPTGQLRCVDLWHEPDLDVESFETASRREAFPRGVGLPGQVWADRAPVWIADVLSGANFPRAGAAAAAGLHAAVGFPIRVRGRVAGVLEFFSRNVTEPDPDLLRLFDVIGAQVGQFTERRDSEEVRDRLAAIVDSSDDAIVSKTLDGIITSWNRSAENVFGYSADEAIGRHITLIIPPELHHEEEAVLARLRRGEKIDHFETERQAKDGRRLNISLTVSPVRNAEGRIVGASKVARDTTERHRAAAALAESERRFRVLADSAPVLIWVNGLDGGCEFVNKAYLDFFGLPLEDVKGFGWMSRLHPDDVERCRSAYREAFEHRAPFRAELRIQRRDGEYRWVESYALPHLAQSGEFLGYVGVSPDITDRKNAEEALRHSEERAQAQADVTRELNRVGAAVASSLDRQSVVQTVTNLAKEVTTAEFGTFGPIFQGDRIVRLEDATADPRYRGNAVVPGIPAADLLVRSYLAVPVKGRAGDVLGGLFFGHSRAGVFTEQHEQLVEGIAAWAAIALENARLHAETERAVQARDEFLSVASHELRNPLNALQLQLVGLSRAAQDGPETLPKHWVCERVSDATDDVGTLVRLVDNLLDVARITSGRVDFEVEDLEFDSVVRGVLDRFAQHFTAHQLMVEIVPVSGRSDRLRLEQILTNLLSNAIKYGEGKPIDVFLRPEGETVRFTVRDRGIGIDPVQQARLFERFSRAVPRSQYGGFGLGLWIARETVRAMGGEISLESRPGAGSTFSVSVPRILVREDASHASSSTRAFARSEQAATLR
jgi:PAS domain S-box-containing protein